MQHAQHHRPTSSFDMPDLPAEFRTMARGDREVRVIDNALEDMSILLVVTGSIAAYKAPDIARMMRSYGAHVDVRVTKSAQQFIGQSALQWAVGGGRVLGSRLGGEVEHLQNYDAVVVAPATYDFINNVANGNAGTPALATVAAALGKLERRGSPVIFAPCMNGDLYNSIAKDSIAKLRGLGARFIAPRTENGKLELQNSEFITVALARALSPSSLRNQPILVTAGPTPVPIDDVRRITNIFTGKLGIEIAKELVVRGADPHFLLGSSLAVPEYLKAFTTHFRSFEEYKSSVAAHAGQCACAVLSAAVADYQPALVYEGKITSNAPILSLPEFVPTPKVIDMLHEERPHLPIVSFKLLSRVSVEELLAEAKRRLGLHSTLVVANRLEDCSADNQVVYLVRKGFEGQRIEGSKRTIAKAIVDVMECLDIGSQEVGGVK